MQLILHLVDSLDEIVTFGAKNAHFSAFLDVFLHFGPPGRLAPQLLINGFRVQVPGRSPTSGKLMPKDPIYCGIGSFAVNQCG